MKTITVTLSRRSYRILLGSRIVALVGMRLKQMRLGSDAYIITNAYLKRKFGGTLHHSLRNAGISLRWKLIADTEKSKSFSVAAKVLADLSVFAEKKKPFIIAFGGGVVGDLAGFVASVYHRGIPYVQIPTTLLAQVDSSIGGKTAVDLAAGKNLAGTFYQPALVVSDVTFLKSLDLRQVRSGLAEVIKYAVIGDRTMFAYLEKNIAKILRKDASLLGYLVKRCAVIKARIVCRDEKEEKGIRTVLNFGHTIGHAIEAAGSYRRYTHGEAVALGMLVAGAISKKMGLLSEHNLLRIEALITRVGLPSRISHISFGRIMKAHYYDKKFTGTINRFVLISGIGSVLVVDNIPEGFIREALQARF